MASKLGQGATEYLVLLAVVLVIALVAIALLMGNLGENMEKRVAESNIALMSGYPIAFVEPPNAYGIASQLHKDQNSTITFFYMINTGSHPITLTKVLANVYSVSYLWYSSPTTPGGFRLIRDY